MKQSSIELLQVILFLLDGVTESEILLKYGMGIHINKAKEIIKQYFVTK
jgi:hypothetical protein